MAAKRSVGVLVAASAWAVAEPALAQPGGPSHLIAVDRADGAEDCPGVGSFSTRVNAAGGALLATPAAPDDQPVLWIRFERTASGYSGTLRTARGERELEEAGANCEGLASALAITAALTLDAMPSASVQASPTPQVDAPKAEPLVAPPVLAPGPGDPARDALGGDEPSDEPEEPPLLWLGLGVAQSASILSSASPGAYLDVGTSLTRVFSAEGTGFVLPHDESPYGPGSIRMTMAGGIGRLCARPPLPLGPFALRGCADLAVAGIVARGEGFDEDTSATQPYVAAGAGAAFEGALAGPIGFSARLDVLAALSRSTFEVATRGEGPDQPPPDGPAFETSAVGVLAGLGFRADLL